LLLDLLHQQLGRFDHGIRQASDVTMPDARF
jgi:hypothetical protein